MGMDFSYKEYSCGCEIATNNYGDYEIEYCPKHKAAPDMYEALKLYQSHQEGTSGHYCWKCEESISNALAKAEQ